MALDIGTVRTGVALADSAVRIAVPQETIATDEASFAHAVQQLLKQHAIDVLVVGYPRNQNGEPTKQTEYVEHMVKLCDTSRVRLVYQDESLSSVTAKQRLGAKADRKSGTIDAEAAAIILQDYLELYT